jgi:hypothetical protein
MSIPKVQIREFIVKTNITVRTKRELRKNVHLIVDIAGYPRRKPRASCICGRSWSMPKTFWNNARWPEHKIPAETIKKLEETALQEAEFLMRALEQIPVHFDTRKSQ